MAWTVLFADAFAQDYEAMPEDAQDALVATLRILREFGPAASRPHVDTLSDSDYPNMKELRFHTANGGQPLHSIRSAKRLCWCAATNRVRARRCFTNG